MNKLESLSRLNLTGRFDERHAQWGNHFYDQNILERRYLLGVRFRN
jgi:iron complex outermembrane recepter protein